MEPFVSQPLCAILEQSGSFLAFDLAEGPISLPKEKLTEFLNHRICLLTDAKLFLEKNNIKPTTLMRLLCIKTINKILPKEIKPFSMGFDLLENQLLVSQLLSAVEKAQIKELVSLECQLLPAIVSMQQNGLPFIKDKWQSYLDNLQKEAQITREKLGVFFKKKDGFALFGPESIDLNNSFTVKEALEDMLGYKIRSLTDSVLKDIDHEAAKLLLSLRASNRLLNTYGQQFLTKVNQDRLRGEFIPIGCSSGRLACQEPNLLALPNHPYFQACISPNPPYKLLRFDYGAFELRILAALSQDQAMLDIFARNADIHSMVAQAVFGKEVSKSINPKLRDFAKVLNFGLIYGMGEKSLSLKLNLPLHQAQKLLKSYFKKFVRVGQFLNELETQALTCGFVKTSLGRIAYFEEEFKDRARIARVARNLPIQGTGADIIKLAICRVFKCLDQLKLDARLVNVVHDEIIIECNSAHETEVKNLIKKEMELAHSSILTGVHAEINIK